MPLSTTTPSCFSVARPYGWVEFFLVTALHPTQVRCRKRATATSATLALVHGPFPCCGSRTTAGAPFSTRRMRPLVVWPLLFDTHARKHPACPLVCVLFAPRRGNQRLRDRTPFFRRVESIFRRFVVLTTDAGLSRLLGAFAPDTASTPTTTALGSVSKGWNRLDPSANRIINS